VASFQPFPGIRFNLARVDLADVLSPPYDVIDERLRADLAGRSPYNAVHIDLPVGEGGMDRYEIARHTLHDWQAGGILATDEMPTFTVYRMSYVDEAGRSRRTTGVIGALELNPPGSDILPHEHTTPKAKSDRLDMLRSCRANLSAIWGLSLAKGLTDLLPIDDPPLTEVTDEDGVTHTIWVVTDAAACDGISEAVAAQPTVIADGHHRYETSLAYRAERAAAEGVAGPAALTMAYIVELIEDELAIRAIHRVIAGLPDRFDVIEALSPWFEPSGPPPSDLPVTTAMERTGALIAVLPERDVLLRPRLEALSDARDLDTARLDLALAALPPHQLTYQHDPARIREAVARGSAQAGVLVRPASIAQIEATAHGGERMPPKTTFFHPKPKTGLVFRGLD
jgi:uncharacterized protein (DUF1015 family)